MALSKRLTKRRFSTLDGFHEPIVLQHIRKTFPGSNFPMLASTRSAQSGIGKHHAWGRLRVAALRHVHPDIAQISPRSGMRHAPDVARVQPIGQVTARNRDRRQMRRTSHESPEQQITRTLRRAATQRFTAILFIQRNDSMNCNSHLL